MTRDEALMWLNDRLGEPFSAEVTVAAYGWAVVTAEGELTHWRATVVEDDDGSHEDDLAGLYSVGPPPSSTPAPPTGCPPFGAVIDLTEMPEWLGATSDGDELVIELGGGVWLRLVHATEAEVG